MKSILKYTYTLKISSPIAPLPVFQALGRLISKQLQSRLGQGRYYLTAAGMAYLLFSFLHYIKKKKVRSGDAYSLLSFYFFNVCYYYHHFS